MTTDVATAQRTAPPPLVEAHRLAAACPELADARAVRVVADWDGPSLVQRLRVKLAGDRSRRVVVKGPGRSPARRTLREELGLPAVEAAVYGMDGDMLGRPVLLGVVEPESPATAGLLVMEDLGDEDDPAAAGAVTEDRVRQLAAFHAYRRTRTVEGGPVPRLDDARRTAFLTRALSHAGPVVRATAWVPAPVRESFPALVDALPSVARTLSRTPVTLLHGDLHTGNVRAGERGLMRVLDWEAASLGDGVVDLVFLALSGADPAAPEASFGRALRWYADEARKRGLGGTLDPGAPVVRAAVVYYALRRIALRADVTGLPGDPGLRAAVRLLADAAVGRGKAA